MGYTFRKACKRRNELRDYKQESVSEARELREDKQQEARDLRNCKCVRGGMNCARTNKEARDLRLNAFFANDKRSFRNGIR